MNDTYRRLNLKKDNKLLSDPINILIVSTSLSEESRSTTLCEHAHTFLTGKGIASTHESLQDYRVLPYGMDGSEGLDTLGKAFAASDAIIFGFPVYNYNMNASMKAVIEHFGRSMNDKVIGLMMAAGGQASYMSGMVAANSLALDFRSWVVPRFVYATKTAFGETGVTDPEIAGRIEGLAWTVYEKTWQHRQKPPIS